MAEEKSLSAQRVANFSMAEWAIAGYRDCIAKIVPADLGEVDLPRAPQQGEKDLALEGEWVQREQGQTPSETSGALRP